MFKNTLRQQLEKYFPDRELARWFDPLDMNMDESRGILRVSFPHAYFGRWFMGSVRRDFESRALSLFEGVRIVYDKADFSGQLFPFSKGPALSPQEIESVSFIGNVPNKDVFSLPLSGIARAGKTVASESRVRGDLPLVEGYSFETFLWNRKNDLPVAAAKECANERHMSCNPFVLYGQSGAGKSHLLGAMANVFKGREKPFFFGGIEFLESVDTASLFQNMGKNQAIFIDDAQRICAFPHLQDALAVLTDRLCGAKKLLVLVFDLHPSHCSGLQPKLRSRLNSGLVAELKRPDLDIRTQYIRRQNELHSLKFDKDTTLAIARKCPDIRSIDGFLSKLRLSLSIGQRAGATERRFVDPVELLNRDDTPGHLTHSHIIGTVARHFSLSPEDITGKSRDRKISLARHMAVLLCKELLGLSLVQTGRIFGGRDHTSVLHSIKRIKVLQESDKDTHNEMEKLRKLCLNRQ